MMEAAKPPIEFYFDFSSPYGYFSATRIEIIAAECGRSVDWRPYLLGIIFKTSGQSPLLGQPLRGPYHRRDMARSARRLGLAFALPDFFPVSGVAAGRAFYWVKDRSREDAVRLALALLTGFFVAGRNIDDPDIVAAIAEETLAIDPASTRAALADPAIKLRLREETDRALAQGVFGSPFFIADGEPFWGNDRLADLRDWLQSGGW